jgi:penicillin-binding protein 1A
VKALTFSAKFLITLLVGATALAASLALVGPAAGPLSHATTPIGRLDLTINAPPARSLVYDRNGDLMSTFASEDRSPVKLAAVPKVLIRAVLSIEDRKFYEHHGVDWAGTARALVRNVDAGGVTQGGSTITQQLVKNVFSVNRKRDLTTKAREAVLAMELEQQLSKDQILEDYLNLVYFGNGAYGVQAAAERYFPSTPLAQLNLAQAALIAGLIQSPEALNPVKYPAAAARRRSEVLDAMVANHAATAAQAKAAKSVPLPTSVSYPHATQLDYYMDEVKNVLLNDDPNVDGDPAEALGANQQARANSVFRGGLKISTAYDPVLQVEATSAVRAQLPKGTPYTASLVVIDNADGGVRAIANGRTFAEMQFDPATEGPGRQAGSSFKAFTLAAALSRGYTPNDSVSGSPISWRTGPGSDPRNVYKLSGDCHGGTPTLTAAIAKSDNCAFVRTELSLGPGNYGADGARAVIDMARLLGIDTSKFNAVVSTTLGTNGVHPLEMAQAYSVFPNEGILKRATIVTKIVDRDGKVLYQAPTAGVRVLDANVARTETRMLTGVVRNGTASGTLGGFPRPIAGKTGTTDRNVDAWFVGYTPQLTTAVWMGNPLVESPMAGVYGGTIPARIWRAFMLDATAPLPPLQFTPPDTSGFRSARFITELGRRTSYYQPYVPPPASVPDTTPPASAPETTAPATTAAPPATEPATAPPTTSGGATPTTAAPPGP